MMRSLTMICLCLLLLYACTDKRPGEQHSPAAPDTGVTVPEDVVPEHMKPGNADTVTPDK